jgi:SAM-dependent methyltransferase
MPGDLHDYAPPAWVRWSETFWSLHAPTFDRDQTGLEIGSYRGENLLRLSPFIGRMVGLESDAAEAAIAAERCRGRPGVDPRPWGGIAFPFPEATFDLVYVDFTRPGFLPRDRALLFAEAKRVLKPDARLLALALGATDAARELRDAWTTRLFEVGFALDELPPLFEPDAFAAELAAAGFEPRVESLGPLLTVEA